MEAFGLAEKLQKLNRLYKEGAINFLDSAKQDLLAELPEDLRLDFYDGSFHVVKILVLAGK